MPLAQSVLLIEDDHDIRVAFRLTLEGCGIYVNSVANEWDALDILEKATLPKLIILDLSMPIMNGEEFLKIKEVNPRIKDIPVLVVSSHQERLDLLHRYPSIKKPVDMDAFTKLVIDSLKP